MKRGIFLVVAGLMLFMVSTIYAGNINKYRGIDKEQVCVNVNGQTDTAKTRVYAVTNSTSDMQSMAADVDRFDMFIMNYSTPVLYVSFTDTSSTTIVANGIKIPTYSTSNSNWIWHIPNYNGAVYFYNEHSGVTIDARTQELKR